MPKPLEHQEAIRALAVGVSSVHAIFAAFIVTGLEIRLANGDTLMADVSDDGRFQLYYPGT